MPKTAQHYYGMGDLYREMQRLGKAHGDSKYREFLDSLHKSLTHRITYTETRIDFDREHNIDTPSAVFHKLEEMRAQRGQIEKVYRKLPPVPPTAAGAALKPKEVPLTPFEMERRAAWLEWKKEMEEVLCRSQITPPPAPHPMTVGASGGKRPRAAGTRSKSSSRAPSAKSSGSVSSARL